MAGVTTYSDEVAMSICEQIAQGKSVRAICSDDSMPAMSTVFKWLNDIPQFSEHYARAREQQAEAFAQELIEIADDESGDVKGDAVRRSQLRVETRKWVASKLLPKKYGDKLDLNVSGELALADRVKRARERSNS